MGVGVLIGFAIKEPILQDECYHSFSDQVTILGIPHFWNVVSNLPFLIVGVMGMILLKKMRRNNPQFFIFFLGIALVSLGSGYYHYWPDSATLIWDRLPMTVAFTALVSIVISEFIDDRLGRRLLYPLVILGIVSIAYWVMTEDLRLYALVQFYPILSIPVVLILFRSEKTSPKGFWLLLLWYIFAKLFEHFDHQIHDSIYLMSGHPLKHVAASIGIYFFITSYTKAHKGEFRPAST